MSVAIKKIQGVESVEVSLNQGLAKIRLKPENKVRLEQLRKVVENNGFTPKEARVTARGDVISANGKWQLKVTGPDEIFELSFDPKAQKTEGELKQAKGKMLWVDGVVAPAKGKRAANRLQVTGFKELKEKGAE